MLSSADNRRNAIEQRRHLHARIARSRRRINGHTIRLVQGGLLPSRWQQQIQDHPVAALATAAGAGMLLAQLCSRTGFARRTADGLAQRLAGVTWTSLLQHAESFLATAGQPESPPSAPEPGDA